jgi:phosphoglycolate phosphatase
MFAVGALWGFRTADELLTSGAAALISSPHELLEWF